MAENDVGAGVWVKRIVLGLLAVASFCLIVAGGIFYVWIIADWLQDSDGFTGLQMIAWFVGLVAAAVIGVGLLLVGLVFRFLDWEYAPRASLVLSIISVCFVIHTYLVFSTINSNADSIELVVLQGGCMLGLLLVWLPPFLHWMFARTRPASPAIELPKAP